MRDYDVSVTGLGFTGLATAVPADRVGWPALGIYSSAARVNEINDMTPGCGQTTSTGRTLICSGAPVSRLSSRSVSRSRGCAPGTAWRKGGRGGQGVLGA
jgi:hypothetical protein